MKNLVRLLTFVLLTVALGWPQSQINSFQILRMGKQSTAPANPPINASYVYFDGTNMVCVTSAGASCLASSGGSGTVTSIATTSPIGGGTITGTGTLTCATCLTATSPTNHGVLIGAGTQAVGATTAGTSGQVLTSNGPSANPTFQAISVATPEVHTVAAASNMDFTTCISASFNVYKINLRLSPGTNAVSMQMLLSADGGATFIADSHYTSVAWRSNTGGGAAASVSNANLFRIDSNPGGATIDNTAAFPMDGDYTFYDPQSTTVNKQLTGIVGDSASSGSVEHASVHLVWATPGTAINAFRINASTGTITGTGSCVGSTL